MRGSAKRNIAIVRYLLVYIFGFPSDTIYIQQSPKLRSSASCTICTTALQFLFTFDNWMVGKCKQQMGRYRAYDNFRFLCAWCGMLQLALDRTAFVHALSKFVASLWHFSHSVFAFAIIWILSLCCQERYRLHKSTCYHHFAHNLVCQSLAQWKK